MTDILNNVKEQNNYTEANERIPKDFWDETSTFSRPWHLYNFSPDVSVLYQTVQSVCRERKLLRSYTNKSRVKRMAGRLVEDVATDAAG